MNFLKKISPVFFILCFTASLFAQPKPGVQFSGTVVDQASQSPVEYATIVIANKADGTPIDGTTTDLDGRFQINSKAKDVIVEISFIGFEKKTISEFTVQNRQVNLGKIELASDAEVLEQVVVRGEKSTTEFKLDKRVFNVGSDLSSTGASALEVLDNVPSVNVSIEGAISLRGSTGVQILINGKPSVLASEEGNALGSITADMIEKIEVITNPSAKYDAEGTAGILNIVLKKSEKRGLNGSVTLNTGIPNNHSIGLSLNRRTEKFNLFSQLGYGRRTFPGEGKTTTIDKVENTVFDIDSDTEKNETFYNVILGTDYHINENNVLTLSGHFALEEEDENSTQNYQLTDADGNLLNSWTRQEQTTATNPKWEYELQYKTDFKDHKDHDLTFSALGSSFGKDKESSFTNTATTGSLNNPDQRAKTNFTQTEYTFKADYTRPIAERFTVETGAQYIMDLVSNDYEVTNFENELWVKDDNFSNIFDFDQKVLGVYTTAAYEGEKWGLKAGLRLENTDVDTELRNTNEVNNRTYTNLFPSAHTSYKVNENLSLQAGYSKRIYRPRLWDVNPFFSFRDNFNISTGNPNLLPEYSDSYELNAIYKFELGSINTGVYHRYTTDVIEDIVNFDNNVTIRQPENVGTNRATGFELNAKIIPVKWLTLMTDLNVNTFVRKGTYEELSFDFNGSRWNNRTTARLKLPADFTVEISGNYRSSFKEVQGEVEDNAFMNIGARKKILNGKAVISLSVRDVFASRRRASVLNQATFDRTYEYQRGRFFTIGLSYGFGKGEAMEFSGQKRY